MKTYYRLKISHDSDPINPRDDDNVGTMLCWHRKYNIGDTNKWKDNSPRTAMLDLIGEIDYAVAEKLRGDDAEASAVAVVFDKYYTSLPVFMYEHSGITIKTSPFSCMFDSGQLGFIYVSHAKARQEYGRLPNKGDTWTEANEKMVCEYLRNEVQAADHYLSGDVYGFVCEKLSYEFEQPDEEVDPDDDEKEWKESDSCWGFQGDDVKANGLLDHLGAKFEDAAKKAMDNLDEWVLVLDEDGKITVAA